MPKINRNGIKINYETYGNGPALFLTHGFSATSKMWDDQIDYLSKYFTLIVWDMRGHGQTDYPDDENLYNEKETIEDIKEILNELKIEKANVGGMSLGGYMSLAFYCKYPEMVENLLIIDTGLINELPNIKVPTLIIVGENDKPFLAAADYMEKKIKISKKIIIKDAGHAVNIDQPSVFNDEVKKFLMS